MNYENIWACVKRLQFFSSQPLKEGRKAYEKQR